jgi:SsrA-binding protein
LIKAYISPYKSAGHLVDYIPDHPRRLLLNKKEINYLVGKTQESGLTVVPLKIYTKNSFLKLEIGLAKGRKRADKREAIKTREVNREIQRRIKSGR